MAVLSSLLCWPQPGFSKREKKKHKFAIHFRRKNKDRFLLFGLFLTGYFANFDGDQKIT